MQYFISRQDQQYGPYSLTDLQRYVAQGNISPDDLARSEGMEEWRPVSQILGNIPAASPPASPNYGQVPVYSMSPAGMPPVAAGAQVNLPNGMHWAVLLLLAVVTCGVFTWVWFFVQAAYVKRLRPENKGVLFYAIGLTALLFGEVVGAAFATNGEAASPMGSMVVLAGVVLLIMGHFQLKEGLEDYYNREEPIRLQLSGVMTFFFNAIYFQYHLNRIRNWKLTGVLG